jgi:beta-lactam-binding protein with PASTA domain
MASEPGGPAADEDTVVDGSKLARSEEVTQPDGEWPVSDLYYVSPEDEGASESGDVEVVTASAAAAPGAAPARRRFPPDIGVGLALAALGVLAALVLGAVFLGLDDDEPAATAQAPTTPTTTATTPADTTTAPPAAPKVEVPDVRGMALDEARETLEEQGLRARVTRSPSEQPRGEVLRQEPRTGSEVARGTVVALFVSDGAGGGDETQAETEVSVPGVVGLSASGAVAAIREAGLEARVFRVTSEERRGTVVDQDPAEGTSVEEGAVVRIEVAKQPPVTVQRVEVPDVVGSPASAARNALREAGLTVATVGVVSQEPAGTVISQSPRAGAEVRKGTRVRLTVSTGPAKVAVPDVTGLDEASARQELERAGFQVQVTDESVTDPAEDGVVLRQTPSGGADAEDGAVVRLVVGRLE